MNESHLLAIITAQLAGRSLRDSIPVGDTPGIFDYYLALAQDFLTTVQSQVPEVPLSTGDLSDWPADSAGVLTNDGAGNLSWGSAGSNDHGALTGLTDDDHTQYLPIDGTRAMTGVLKIDSLGIQGELDQDFHIHSYANSTGSAYGFEFHIHESGVSTQGLNTTGDYPYFFRNGLEPVYYTVVTPTLGLRHYFHDGGLTADKLEFHINSAFPELTVECQTNSGTDYMNLHQQNSLAGIYVTHPVLELGVDNGVSATKVVLIDQGGVFAFGPGVSNVLSLGVDSAEWADARIGKIYGLYASGGDLYLYSTNHSTKGNIYFGSGATFDETNERLGIGTLTPSYPLHSVKTDTSTGGTVGNGYFSLTLNPSGASTANCGALDVAISTASGSINKASTIQASRYIISRNATDSGTITNMYGLYIQALNTAPLGTGQGAIGTNMIALLTQAVDNSSTTSSTTGIMGQSLNCIINSNVVASRVITNFLGLKVTMDYASGSSSTTVTNWTPIQIRNNADSLARTGTATNAISIDIEGWYTAPVFGGGTMTFTNLPEQIRLRDLVTSGIAIRQQGTNGHSRFQGGICLGADATPDYVLHLQGSAAIMTIDEITSTPTLGTSSNQMRLYVKGDKLILQWNDAGTARYKYLTLSGTGVAWTYSATAP